MSSGSSGNAGPRRHGSRVEVVVGKVGRAHGLTGDVFVEVRTDEPQRRFAVGTRFTTSRGPLTVDFTRWQGRRLLVRFAEIEDRDAAERISGVELSLDVPADERPDDPEEFYDHQLLGLSARTTEGDPIGAVTEVLHLPAQDLLVVETASGRPALIPFVRAVVPHIDLAAGLVTVADPAGLLPTDADDVAGAADLGDSSVEGGNDAHRHRLDLS